MMPPFNNPQLLIFPLILILAVVSITLKNLPIGGWLLFFCGHIYIIIIASLILTTLNNRVFFTLHEMGLERYLALLAARLPLLGTGIIAVVALTMLLIHSDWNDVIRLRYILMAHASACVLATLVDLKYFPTVAPQRMAGLVTFSTWIAYFFMSTRVRSVFLTHDWGQTR